MGIYFNLRVLAFEVYENQTQKFRKSNVLQTNEQNDQSANILINIKLSVTLSLNKTFRICPFFVVLRRLPLWVMKKSLFFIFFPRTHINYYACYFLQRTQCLSTPIASTLCKLCQNTPGRVGAYHAQWAKNTT